MEKNPLRTKSKIFALKIISLYKQLCTDKKEFVLSKQLLRSATSVGAMIREAQNAESRADFVHKLAIGQKECDETLYWLELLTESGYMENKEFQIMLSEGNELLRMIKSSILTAKSRIK